MERFLHDVLQHHPHHYQDSRWLGLGLQPDAWIQAVMLLSLA